LAFGTDDWFEGITPAIVDLHLHTTASDGTLTPTELIDLIGASGIRIAAVTDHDSTSGLPKAFEAASRYPDLRLIPGIELSGYTDHAEVHVLGLFIDYKQPDFQAILEKFRNGREIAVRESVERLRGLGKDITWERVRELAGGTVGRPHIARALLEKGYISTMAEAFEKYLGDGGSARVQRRRLSTAEAIKLIHGIGGVAAVAHPRTVEGFDEEIPALVADGLDAIEVFAEKYGPDKLEHYSRVARENNLVPIGGSDYHHNGEEGELKPGSSGVPGPDPAAVDELERRAEAHRVAANG
jgi:predicted metal-dependent phosphoesterase TrpH